jgi:hypothetical protein
MLTVTWILKIEYLELMRKSTSLSTLAPATRKLESLTPKMAVVSDAPSRQHPMDGVEAEELTMIFNTAATAKGDLWNPPSFLSKPTRLLPFTLAVMGAVEKYRVPMAKIYL